MGRGGNEEGIEKGIDSAGGKTERSDEGNGERSSYEI